MNKKILIIDDEQDVQTVLGKRLKNSGYEVFAAENGNDGLIMARLRQPDLIILDKLLGDMLGEEVGIKLKECPDTKEIPIIFISCMYSKRDIEENMLSHRPVDHKRFAKPYDIDEILTAVNKCLRENEDEILTAVNKCLRENKNVLRQKEQPVPDGSEDTYSR